MFCSEMAKVKNAPASGVRCSARLDLGGFQDLFSDYNGFRGLQF
jgi:hypothetical protein